MLSIDLHKQLWHFNLQVSFTVDPGQVMVLWGPSGAGKTTVLECISGLRFPDQGQIKLQQRLLFSSSKNINLPARKRGIGYLFQNYALFPHMTVGENIGFGPRYHKNHDSGSQHWCTEMMQAFGIKHLIDRYPFQLSGGEKQRAALARAMAAKPELLLLDEPFSSLDQPTKLDLRALLKEVKKDWAIPIILVTHDIEDAQALGDHFINIHEGECSQCTNIRPDDETSRRG